MFMPHFIKRSLLLCSFVLLAATVRAQSNYWVFFTDRGEAPMQRLAQAESLLSAAALQARAQKGIPLTPSDLLPYEPYVQQVKALGVPVVSQSRWLNAVVVSLRPEQVEQVAELACVQGLQATRTLVRARSQAAEGFPPDEPSDSRQAPFTYGQAAFQTNMLKVERLHEKGYTGRGVRIALFDAGFREVERMQVFDSLRLQGRLLAFYDFVADDDSTLFEADRHGTEVLSTIAANQPGNMVGTAPHVSVILCRTENAFTETRQEEHNWVRALEWVDSIGVDMVHTSLGYHDFDDKSEDYTFEDMDGNTTVITRAADMAAAKGILVTTSAGNEGGSKWRHITAPCDADSVLCIGSINKNIEHSSFSSIGPTADGRVKPDVVALGSAVTVATPGDRISYSNGTSFSAPIVAGMVACLRQAHPERSNMDIIQAVRLSADQYKFPDEQYGYGVPNAAMADSLLTHVEDLSTVDIRMDAKPQRGAKPQPIQPKKPAATPAPSFELVEGEGFVEVRTPSPIQEAYILYGQQRLTFDPEEVSRSEQMVRFRTEYLLKGDQPYLIHVKTDTRTEYLKFSPN